METESNSIDTAISVCNDKINVHRGLANKFLYIIITLTLLFVTSQAVKLFYENLKNSDIQKTYQQLTYNADKLKDLYGYTSSKSVTKRDSLNEIQKLAYLKLDVTNNALKELKQEVETSKKGFDDYILYGIFILIFSIVTSFYRFHQKEVSKYEHYLIGFHRIRIAANNSPSKFETEVRFELTRDAFSYETSKPLFSSEKKIESPVPGHPTSDVATLMINKIFEAIEIKAKK